MSTPTYTFSGTTNFNVIEHMGTAQKTLTSDLDELDQFCRLTLANWTDTSKEQYQTRKANWDQAAATMPASLSIAATTLESITNRLVHANLRVRDMWTK
jgi:uncharacterized protein YukE